MTASTDCSNDLSELVTNFFNRLPTPFLEVGHLLEGCALYNKPPFRHEMLSRGRCLLNVQGFKGCLKGGVHLLEHLPCLEGKFLITLANFVFGIYGGNGKVHIRYMICFLFYFVTVYIVIKVSTCLLV